LEPVYSNTQSRSSEFGIRNQEHRNYEIKHKQVSSIKSGEMLFQIIISLLVNTAFAEWSYLAEIISKAPVPSLSYANPVGHGNSPCLFNFNPAFIPAGPGLERGIAIVRVSNCTRNYKTSNNRLMYAFCEPDGTCGDLQEEIFPFEQSSQDPRVFFYNNHYWMYYYANGIGSDDVNSVYLRKTKTPLDVNSWKLVTGRLPWKRNGCAIIRDDGNHYIVYGESRPLPSLGIARTKDFINYEYVNESLLFMNGEDHIEAPEVVIEAATAPVQLTTGDYFHLYAAGTPGWVENGNYTGGWIILDGNDPTIVKQRSTLCPQWIMRLGMVNGPSTDIAQYLPLL
jgi:predicted GH43/DUF377 family glycosyl hydrolase